MRGENGVKGEEKSETRTGEGGGEGSCAQEEGGEGRGRWGGIGCVEGDTGIGGWNLRLR